VWIVNLMIPKPLVLMNEAYDFSGEVVDWILL
jgi:hypothetical protein